MILQAAEKRLDTSRGKPVDKPISTSSTAPHGKAVVSGLPEKRSFEQTSESTKMKKFRPSDDAAVGSDSSSAGSEIIELSVYSPPSAASKSCPGVPSRILPDMVAEVEDSPTEMDVIDVTENSPPSSSATPTTVCPVCGRTDIPTTVINSHIAYCLEEMELLSEEEIF